MSRFEPYWAKYASSEKPGRFTVTHFIQIMIVFAGLAVILTRLGSVELQSSDFNWNDQALTVREPRGETWTLSYTDILSMELRTIAEYGSCVHGMDTDSTCYGIWCNEEFGDYRLYVQKDVPLCIVITAGEGISVLNLESEDVTRQLYDQILQYKTASLCSEHTGFFIMPHQL